MTGKEKVFRFEYTAAGSRDTKQYRMIRAMNPRVAVTVFNEEMTGRTGIEITDVYQHVMTGSVQTIRKNTLKPV